MHRIVLTFLFCLSFIAYAQAESISSSFSGLVKNPVSVKPDSIIDGTHFLASDKKIYVLPNLDIPEKFPDIAQDAQIRLGELLKNLPCTLHQTRTADKGRITRMNHHIAHISCGESNIWISGQLVREGLATVRPDPAFPELANELLELEDLARTEKKGLWSENKITIETPETIGDKLSSYQIITGKIHNISLTGNMLYINFGKNWREDFTIGIPAPIRKKFAKRGLNLQSLNSRTVRVRGLVRAYNGPFIEIETPEQLEILPEAHQTTAQPSAPDTGTKTD